MEVMLSFIRFHRMQCGELIHLTDHVSERVPNVELCLSHAKFGQAFSLSLWTLDYRLIGFLPFPSACPKTRSSLQTRLELMDVVTGLMPLHRMQRGVVYLYQTDNS